MNNLVNKDDNLIIEKAKKGSEEAITYLMNKYYPRVYSSLYSFTKSHQDSEDLAQQTFIKVWSQIDKFRGESAFFTWVYRIAINLAKNYVSSASYKKSKLNISSDDFDLEFNSVSNPELDLIHSEALELISNFIKTLPELLKTSFLLREEDGKSYEEISKITNTPIGTVRSRIFRARELILNFISEEISGEWNR